MSSELFLIEFFSAKKQSIQFANRIKENCIYAYYSYFTIELSRLTMRFALIVLLDTF